MQKCGSCTREATSADLRMRKWWPWKSKKKKQFFFETRLHVLGLVSLEECIGGSRTWSHVTNIKWFYWCGHSLFKYYQNLYRFSSAKLNFSFQTVLYLHKILFLILLFLLRILFCLKSICPCITAWLLIDNAICSGLLHLQLCVEWGSTSTGWHINVHYVKILHTHKVWN